MSESREVLGRDDRDIIKAQLIRRMFGVRSISSFPSVVQGDMALATASDVIDIVLKAAAPLILAAERERIATALDAAREEHAAEDAIDGCDSRFCAGWLLGQRYAAEVTRTSP